MNALAGKQPLDSTLTSLAGKNIAGLLAYLGLTDIVQSGVGLACWPGRLYQNPVNH